MTLKLLFAGDGPRDEAAVPRLVSGLLGVEIEASFEPWQGLHVRGGGKGLGGYGRKLLYLIRVARDRAVDGITATVDCDKAAPREKLRDLISARQRDRATGKPDAHGCWGSGSASGGLAARRSGRCSHRAWHSASNGDSFANQIKSPKEELDRLHGESGGQLAILDLLAAIAGGLDQQRCNHRGETGWEAFVRDVTVELGPLCRT